MVTLVLGRSRSEWGSGGAVGVVRSFHVVSQGGDRVHRCVVSGIVVCCSVCCLMCCLFVFIV